jgi:hypothetical protein
LFFEGLFSLFCAFFFPLPWFLFESFFSVSLLSLDSSATGRERLISLEVFTGWKIGACEGLF